MPFPDPLVSVSLVGLAVQTGIQWTFAVIFALLARGAGRPAYFLDWTRASFCAAGALTAILARFLLPPSLAGAVPALQGLYQVGKLLALVLLLRGTLRFVHGDAAPRWPRLVVPAAILYAMATGLAADAVEPVIFWQSLIAVPVAFVSGLLLLRLPGARRSLGTRITAASLLGWSALWAVYGGLTTAFLGGGSGARLPSLALRIFLVHNSYFDVVLLVAMSAGMIVLLLHEAHRVSRRAQEEQARLELELERGERLRALGALVSSVAHDLNNPLTAVLGFAEELERSTSGSADELPARVIREQAQRCRAIVHRLSSLVGDHAAARRPFDAAEAGERAVRAARPRFDAAGVRLALSREGGAAPILGDSGGIEEVFDHLLDNALRASPRGAQVGVAFAQRDGRFEARVRDEGRGVPEAARQRIFDPFFTLRPENDGRGIGLTLARGIARAHAGSLELESASPEGACFLLSLPLLSDAATGSAPLQAAARRVSEHAAGPRCALVVDDERLVRRVLRQWLQRRGWRVEEAEDGAAALQRLREAADEFDAVLCDLRMPCLSGIALHDLLAREQPEWLARFVFVTGDLASPESSAFALRCERPIVRKPFDNGELEAALVAVAGEVHPHAAPCAR